MAPNEPVTEADEPARKKIADRDWIDDSGKVVDEEAATGVRYTFLGRTKDGVTIPPDGQSYQLYFRDLTPACMNMLAGFGAITLMGNVTNTWMGDKSPDKDAKACDAIAARFALMNNPDKPVWADRSGGVGARVDRDALAQAIVEVLTANGRTAELTAVRERCNDDEFVKSSRTNAEVAAAYARIVGRQTASLDDIFGGLAA